MEMNKKKLLLALVCIMVFSFFCYGVVKVYNKFTLLSEEVTVLSREVVSLNKEVAGQYEAYVMNNKSAIDTFPHHVLCLGNSITCHSPKEDVGWYSDWGMAASCIEKDYCHQLEKMLKAKNDKSTVTPLNISNWESNLGCDIDSLIGKELQDKDIVIIRLGENVQDIDLFRSKIVELAKYCKLHTPNVVVTGCFWENADKEECLIRAAYLNHLKYIPLFWITRGHKDVAYPKPSDKITDLNCGTYTLTHDGVLKHPGDEGMKIIADCIYNCL